MTSNFDTIAAGPLTVVTLVDIVVRRSGWDVAPITIALASAPIAGSSRVSPAILDLGDIVETAGQEIPAATLDISDCQVNFVDPRSLRELALRGVLDGAAIKVTSRYASLSGASEDALDFSGYIDRAIPTVHGVSLDLRAWVGRLAAASYPRNTVSPWCRYEFMNASTCGYATAYAWPQGPIVAGSTRTSIRVDVALDTYDARHLGLDRFRAGSVLLLSGSVRYFQAAIESIVLVSGTVHEARLAPPGFPWAPDIGDTAQLIEGCDKSAGACQARGNFERFGGFPFVPPPESVA